MTTKQSTVDAILDQLVSVDSVAARKMFGGYVLYCDGKVVGLICNDALYVKITEQGKKFVGKSYEEGRAYEGAKVSMLINSSLIEDREWLSKLVRTTADNLPSRKTKKARKKSSSRI